jgi:hypothetical protein
MATPNFAARLRPLLRTTAAVLAVLTVPTLIAPLLAVPCAATEAHSWASGLASTNFDEALVHIGDVPRAYQAALLSRATPEDRARVWKAAVQNVRRAYPSHFAVTQERDALLAEVEARFSPETFSHHPTATELAGWRNLQQRLEVTFDRDTMYALLFGLGHGPGDRTTGLPLAQKVNYVRANLPTRAPRDVAQWIASWKAIGTVQARVDGCSCSVEWGVCILPPWYGKACKVAACDPSGWGCGPGGLQQCDGQCDAGALN